MEHNKHQVICSRPITNSSCCGRPTLSQHLCFWLALISTPGALASAWMSGDPVVDDATQWNDTAPTSSVFSVGTANSTNGSSDNMIAYCFTEKKGYSKFGKYVANGNADGNFIYTGFKPAFLTIKNTSTGSTNWPIKDNKRS